jgi:integrase
LIRHGESVKTVQKRLGHSSAAITLDTYAKARELHQAGEKSQVTRSPGQRSGIPEQHVTAA